MLYQLLAVQAVSSPGKTGPQPGKQPERPFFVTVNFIKFDPKIASIVGCSQAGLMLCAAIHLSRQEGGGWFQKTQSQWEELTCLSRNEQETARLKLKQFPFWQEKLTGIPAQLSYRVDIDQLGQLKFKKQNPKFHRKNGFVYLMRNNRNLFTKIGFSKNPSFRERTLQSEEPDIEIIFQCPGTIELEGECHYRFSAYRVRGEWFRLSEIDIEEAKEFISREKN